MNSVKEHFKKHNGDGASGNKRGQATVTRVIPLDRIPEPDERAAGGVRKIVDHERKTKVSQYALTITQDSH